MIDRPSESSGERPAIGVGLLGCGNVGSALVRLLRSRTEEIRRRLGTALELRAVAVRNLSKDREAPLEGIDLTRDAESVIDRPDVHVVVELIGGIEPARALLRRALEAGKPVVTANKELLANVGAELFDLAESAGVDLLFEAAVGGAIPIVRPLRESLAAERVRRITGIVNGTTNYVLTRMAEEGASYEEALGEAQGRGYAERDPTADVEGYDAAAKIAILASIAFGGKVVAGDVYREGISGITQADMAFAERLGYVVKLLAIAEAVGSGAGREVSVRVHPAMVPKRHPLAAVRGSHNAVFVEGEAVGELMFFGRGAGGMPTAGAVLGDLVDAASNLLRGSASSVGRLVPVRVRAIDELVSEYYLNLAVVDRPGVLAKVAAVFGRHGVSIRSMEQEGLGDEARLVFITHLAREADMQATVAELRHLDVVRSVGSLLRVVGEEDAPDLLVAGGAL
ncbi:MAG: homoserine dehydrogenase [Acidimicrobiales bacterium]|nr:MAG: homoserine dehydrogenase [Acidimicrobiales bacterium]